MPDESSTTAPEASVNESSTAARTRFPPWLSPPTAAALPPMSEDGVRALVLDYLAHSTYVDSAVSFVREWERSDPQTSSSSSNSARDAALAGPSGTNGAATTTTTAASNGDTEMHSSTSTLERARHTTLFELDVDDVDAEDDADGSTSDTFDSPLLSRKTIRLIRVRKEIKRLIQQGSIQAAIDLCNLHFPSVLATLSPATAAASPIPISSTTKHRPYTPQFSQGSSTPSRAPSRLSHKPSNMSLASSSASAATASPANFPIQPLLLSLSLQIQLFIEIIRSNASSGPPGAAAAGVSRPSTPFSAAASPSSNADLGGNMEASTASLASSSASAGSAMSGVSGTSSVNGATAALSQALSHAQSLHVQANKIQDLGMRNIYLRELESVSGLLPYHDPRKSPVAYYLDESRRDALAEAVNGAILLSLGETSTSSRLENIVKQNELVWQSAAELKINFPPDKGQGKNAPIWPVLPFDMQEFLERPSFP